MNTQTKNEQYVPQGFLASEFPTLLRNLEKYATSGDTAPRTFYMDGTIKYRLTVKNSIAANCLYFAFTGKQVAGADEIKKEWLPPRFTGKISSPSPHYKKNQFTANDAMRLYGHPFRAYTIIKRQYDAMGEVADGNPYFNESNSLLDELKERAVDTNQNQELEKMGAPLTPSGSHTLTSEEHAELCGLIREKKDAELKEQERKKNELKGKRRKNK